MTDRAPTAAAHVGQRDILAEVEAFAAIVRRRWQVVAISVAVVLILSVLYLAGTRRLYEATTRVLILQQGGRPLSVGSHDVGYQAEGTEDLLATHAVVISSPLVVGRAIESIGMKNLPSLSVAKDPLAAAINNLKIVRPDRLADILQISYRAGSTDEAIQTVEAITQSYRRFLEEKYQRDNGEQIKLITKARDELGRELEKLESGYLEFRRSSPTLVVGSDGDAPIARRLEQWDRAAGDAMIRAVQLRTQLELGRMLAAEGAELWAIAHAISQIGGNSDSLGATIASRSNQTGTMDFIRQLEAEQQQLAERYGPNYSKVVEIRDTINRTHARARAARSKMDEGEVRDLLSAIEMSLTMVESMHDNLTKGYEGDQALAKEVELDLLTESNLRSNLERHRALFNTVVDQLKQAQFVSDYETIHSETIEPVNARPEAVHPRIGLTLAIALFAGLALGSAGAVVADRLDRRIQTVEDLRHVLGLHALGYVPIVPEAQATEIGEFGLISRRRPRSSWAEAYRAVRTNIELLRRTRRIHVMMVTSPHSGDGKSVSASNLAISLAGAGRRVLLIDGDLRKPMQHRIHGVSNASGMTHVLRDLLTFDRVVQRTDVDGLDLVTTGPMVENPADLLMTTRFGRMLEEVRDRYDLVIIDTSPILAVTDAVLIGSLADGVVLVTQATTLSRREAEEMLEKLRGLETPILGAIFNRVTFERYGYGYGAYGEHPIEDSGGPPDTPRPAEQAESTEPERTQHTPSHANGHPLT